MKNKYFPDEEITMNDLYFVCYMIERVARHIKQKNKYVMNYITYLAVPARCIVRIQKRWKRIGLEIMDL